MSSRAYWTVTGTTVDNSTDAFIKSVQHVTNGKALKKYERKLNEKFKEHMQANMRQAGIGDKNFDELFYLTINHGNIIFTNTEPLITQRYEYGYNNDNNDEYYDEGYMIETSPRYFIRPAIQQTMQDVGNLMTQEANKEYMRNRRQTNGDDIY